MNPDELIVEIVEIPIEKEATLANLDLLIKHAEYLASIDGVVDAKARALLSTAPAYVLKQVRRFRLNIDDEADLFAWVSRCLFELFIMTRYMYSSADRYDEIIHEQLKDLRDIEKVIVPKGTPQEEDSKDIVHFHDEMTEMWTALSEYGIEKEDLKKPNPARMFAEGADLLQEYLGHWKLHSKYVHPTSFLLFGRQEFVYGLGAKHYFWVLIQYYAARILRDLNLMIEAMPGKKSSI